MNRRNYHHYSIYLVFLFLFLLLSPPKHGFRELAVQAQPQLQPCNVPYSLVVWYDFEGENNEQRLKDKSPEPPYFNLEPDETPNFGSRQNSISLSSRASSILSYALHNGHGSLVFYARKNQGGGFGQDAIIYGDQDIAFRASSPGGVSLKVKKVEQILSGGLTSFQHVAIVLKGSSIISKFGSSTGEFDIQDVDQIPTNDVKLLLAYQIGFEVDDFFFFNRSLSDEEIQILKDGSLFCCGYRSNDTGVCNGHGSCNHPDFCTCNTGFFGRNCENYTCSNKLPSDLNVCSGNGLCVGFNNCSCNTGYTGPECQFPVCYGIASVSANVCSARGQCISYNNCSCNDGYTGEQCEFPLCFDVPANNPLVCSSNGDCIKWNFCDCESGYVGNRCEIPICYGKLGNMSDVCGGKGICISDDNCSCHDCFVGTNCELNKCQMRSISMFNDQNKRNAGYIHTAYNLTLQLNESIVVEHRKNIKCHTNQNLISLRTFLYSQDEMDDKIICEVSSSEVIMAHIFMKYQETVFTNSISIPFVSNEEIHYDGKRGALINTVTSFHGSLGYSPPDPSLVKCKVDGIEKTTTTSNDGKFECHEISSATAKTSQITVIYNSDPELLLSNNTLDFDFFRKGIVTFGSNTQNIQYINQILHSKLEFQLEHFPEKYKSRIIANITQKKVNIGYSHEVDEFSLHYEHNSPAVLHVQFYINVSDDTYLPITENEVVIIFISKVSIQSLQPTHQLVGLNDTITINVDNLFTIPDQYVLYECRFLNSSSSNAIRNNHQFTCLIMNSGQEVNEKVHIEILSKNTSSSIALTQESADYYFMDKKVIQDLYPFIVQFDKDQQNLELKLSVSSNLHSFDRLYCSFKNSFTSHKILSSKLDSSLNIIKCVIENPAEYVINSGMNYLDIRLHVERSSLPNSDYFVLSQNFVTLTLFNGTFTLQVPNLISTLEFNQTYNINFEKPKESALLYLNMKMMPQFYSKHLQIQMNCTFKSSETGYCIFPNILESRSIEVYRVILSISREGQNDFPEVMGFELKNVTLKRNVTVEGEFPFLCDVEECSNGRDINLILNGMVNEYYEHACQVIYSSEGETELIRANILANNKISCIISSHSSTQTVAITLYVKIFEEWNAISHNHGSLSFLSMKLYPLIANQYQPTIHNIHSNATNVVIPERYRNDSIQLRIDDSQQFTCSVSSDGEMKCSKPVLMSSTIVRYQLQFLNLEMYHEGRYMTKISKPVLIYAQSSITQSMPRAILKGEPHNVTLTTMQNILDIHPEISYSISCQSNGTNMVYTGYIQTVSRAVCWVESNTHDDIILNLFLNIPEYANMLRLNYPHNIKTYYLDRGNLAFINLSNAFMLTSQQEIVSFYLFTPLPSQEIRSNTVVQLYYPQFSKYLQMDHQIHNNDINYSEKYQYSITTRRTFPGRAFITVWYKDSENEFQINRNENNTEFIFAQKSEMRQTVPSVARNNETLLLDIKTTFNTQIDYGYNVAFYCSLNNQLFSARIINSKNSFECDIFQEDVGIVNLTLIMNTKNISHDIVKPELFHIVNPLFLEPSHGVIHGGTNHKLIFYQYFHLDEKDTIHFEDPSVHFTCNELNSSELTCISPDMTSLPQFSSHDLMIKGEILNVKFVVYDERKISELPIQVFPSNKGELYPITIILNKNITLHNGSIIVAVRNEVESEYYEIEKPSSSRREFTTMVRGMPYHVAIIEVLYQNEFLLQLRNSLRFSNQRTIYFIQSRTIQLTPNSPNIGFTKQLNHITIDVDLQELDIKILKSMKCIMNNSISFDAKIESQGMVSCDIMSSIQEAQSVGLYYVSSDAYQGIVPISSNNIIFYFLDPVTITSIHPFITPYVNVTTTVNINTTQSIPFENEIIIECSYPGKVGEIRAQRVSFNQFKCNIGNSGSHSTRALTLTVKTINNTITVPYSINTEYLYFTDLISISHIHPFVKLFGSGEASVSHTITLKTNIQVLSGRNLFCKRVSTSGENTFPVTILNERHLSCSIISIISHSKTDVVGVTLYYSQDEFSFTVSSNEHHVAYLNEPLHFGVENIKMNSINNIISSNILIPSIQYFEYQIIMYPSTHEAQIPLSCQFNPSYHAYCNLTNPNAPKTPVSLRFTLLVKNIRSNNVTSLDMLPVNLFEKLKQTQYYPFLSSSYHQHKGNEIFIRTAKPLNDVDYQFYCKMDEDYISNIKFLDSTSQFFSCEIEQDTNSNITEISVYTSSTKITESLYCESCEIGTYSNHSSAIVCKEHPPGEFTNGSTFCEECPIETVLKETTSPICEPCPPGYFINSSGILQCDICPIGTFSNSSSSPLCQQCSIGYFTYNIGSTSCEGCRVGTFFNESLISCQECPQGYFKDNVDSLHCKPCPTGTFTNQTSTITCVPCSPGYFINTTGSLNCEKCVMGTFASEPSMSSCKQCPPGYYTSNNESTFCNPCPEGTFSNITGSITEKNCIECPKGTYADETGLSSCKPCPPGFINSKIGEKTCIPCPEGRFANEYGSTECKICYAGSYNSYLNASNCELCPPGTFSTEVEAITSEVCKRCAPGKFSSESGSITCYDCPKGSFGHISGLHMCIECPPGTYSDINGTRQCKMCERGYFSEDVGGQKCYPCPNGTASMDIAAMTAESCTQCENGTYAKEGYSVCVDCPPGTFNPIDGASECQQCPIGTFSNVRRSNTIETCQECIPGTFSNQSGLSHCYSCSPGYYSNLNGAKLCEQCPPGKYSSEYGSTSCDNCSMGSYNPYFGSRICELCPAGTFSNKSGAISPISCNLCYPGSYSSENGSTFCKLCEPGSYNPSFGASICQECPLGAFSNISGGISNSSCILCPRGFFSNTTSSTICFPCNAGTYSPIIGVSHCEQCPPGTFSNTTGAMSNDTCNHCPEGTYSSKWGSGYCDTCADGETSGLGSAECVSSLGENEGAGIILKTILEYALPIAFGIAVIFTICILILLCLSIVVVVYRKKKVNNVDESYIELSDLLLTNENENFAPVAVDVSMFQIDFEELKDMKEIGIGGSGCVVFKAKWKNRDVVVKMFRYTSMDSTGLEQFVNELKFYMSLRDKNIVYFYGACMKPPRIGIVIEYCENGTLKEYMKKNKHKMSIKQKLQIAEEIANGMSFLHSNNIIHRDLKSDNILIDGDYHAKITDFGISKSIESSSNTVRVGTSAYMAPEVTLGEEYDEKCDVYSFGIVLYEILTENFSPYGNPTFNIENRVSRDPTFRPVVPQNLEIDSVKRDCIKLMAKCWNHEPSDRPAFNEIYSKLKQIEEKDEKPPN